jgi:hypothetical protein
LACRQPAIGACRRASAEFLAIGTAVEEISKVHVIDAPALVLPVID